MASPPNVRRAAILIAGALIGGGFYLLLIDTTSLPELYVLAGVAVGCALLFEVSREQGFVEARLAARWLLATGRPLTKVPADIARLCWEALVQLAHPRPAGGTFRAVRFEATHDTAEDGGRRALTEWLGSLAPNTIVVGVDSKRGLLLVHQLRRQGDPSRLDPLRLG